MACPLRSAFRSFAFQRQGAASRSWLPRRLCSSSAEEAVVTPEVIDTRGTTTPDLSRDGGSNLPAGQQYTEKIRSIVSSLQIPEEHSEQVRRALTDRTFNESIFLARRKAGNRKEVLEADLHNLRLATLGNSVINFVLTETLLHTPDLQLNAHGIQELCYILMNPEKLHTLLSTSSLDAYIRTSDPELTDLSRTTAAQAIVGCLLEAKGQHASVEYVKDNMVPLDITDCHRLLQLNHPKLCLMHVLQRSGSSPPVLRITGGQSDSVVTYIVSGDRVLAEVPTSAPITEAQQEHLACQKALLEHFPKELAALPVPHSSVETSDSFRFREESELSFAREGESTDHAKPGWTQTS